MNAVVAALGALSVISGAALLVNPQPLLKLYGLPRSTALGRALGVRDVVIGAGLLRKRAPRTWLVSRAAADGFDALLIAGAARGRWKTIGRVAIACSSSMLSAQLARSAR